MMQNGKNNLRKGFSLLELLLYIAILAIIMTFITGAFFSINQGRARVEAATEVNSNMRFAVDKIAQDIKAASAVAVPATASATSTALQLTVDGTSVQYCVLVGRIRRQSGGACSDASDVVTGDAVVVDSLLFTRLENSNVVLGKAFVTVGVSIELHYNSDAPEWQYAAVKQTTVPLHQ
ncbi:hypothetical protein A2524_01295 [Candidatus Wolfebacteria bacterium RIFOXYD12_FULL_48_21]|uniref:Prepilin-type N-terminal cleavage/methylation domain-containing protein n=1 Tax=Candidatus Wolfebacteria bacterium RIFOXYD1_FULL_48_65 TaxID=1802561 RepID=A0A1F8DYY8_9BACT|nr:MAG: hypothetical protein A2610_00480 [Candidatus Wolfebacteria bacterium RIFOXYD1_FULL_48_65]OGM94443.1 MAG: hypothetical protein A2524_01295 [Candidatus Wolfebacteria bacterium RIFOXYD12_FULL_48_21]OGM97159.1 MAG: hypothetical protein A2532_01950 [Candidatus Wolfebacteria bacterium RIFOXYD2_FULL_48_11]